MDRDTSRRGFVVDLLATVLGGAAAIAGFAGLSSALSGCSDDTAVPPAVKYGANFDGGAKIDAMPAVKYGPLLDRGTTIDATPAVKYGANFDLAPAVKYGGNFDLTPAVKYGPLLEVGPTPKYGIKVG